MEEFYKELKGDDFENSFVINYQEYILLPKNV